MARAAEIERQTAEEKMLEVLERHLAKYSPEERRERWEALGEYVRNVQNASRAKP